MITLSPDQQLVLDTILTWYKKRPESDETPFITLGGYAGTGKTTLMAIIRQELAKLTPELKVGFASYTGKAARVLRTKLTENNVMLPQDTVGTIHSLIYSPIVNEKEEIVGWKTKDTIDHKLIIIDEASMVDESIWRHLRTYRVPIIAVGDHGQLPPIHGTFNLLQDPQLRLEQIHRQASLHPIIGLSIQARDHGIIRTCIYSDTVKKYDLLDTDAQDRVEELLGSYDRDTLVLCGYNTTRVRLNNHIRNIRGFESHEPVGGDRVICLRNNHAKNIFNGMLGTIVSIEGDDEFYRATIELDDEKDLYKGLISKVQFGAPTALNFTNKRSRIMACDLFDFGYAMTVHKSQGSQARRVILFEERFRQMDNDQWKRWLYTAVTRAEEELYIFSRG
ncbi:MAG: ATP-dependent RecD-like DNA helicase [Microgenomates bacterium OLB22]|nr:MAG: ATP-dependent RecD-like DNA helicase [Microgenomates bacterium OLB22]